MFAQYVKALWYIILFLDKLIWSLQFNQHWDMSMVSCRSGLSFETVLSHAGFLKGPLQNGGHFADDNLKSHFFFWIVVFW